jgi:hypothetical protein
LSAPVTTTKRSTLAWLLTACVARRAAAAEPSLPGPLKTLQAELSRFSYCPDEACVEGDDWWGFWWSLPDRGCGDCEDFAAYSYARLRQLGIAEGAIRLMAAEVGQQPRQGGEPATLVHVWLEVDVDGRTWTVSNRQIRAGTWRQGRRILSRAEIDTLVDRSFGPNWPYGIEIP